MWHRERILLWSCRPAFLSQIQAQSALTLHKTVYSHCVLDCEFVFWQQQWQMCSSGRGVCAVLTHLLSSGPTRVSSCIRLPTPVCVSLVTLSDGLQRDSAHQALPECQAEPQVCCQRGSNFLGGRNQRPSPSNRPKNRSHKFTVWTRSLKLPWWAHSATEATA